jgi:hypothetical protein
LKNKTPALGQRHHCVHVGVGQIADQKEYLLKFGTRNRDPLKGPLARLSSPVGDVNGPEFMIGYTITEIIRYRIIQMVTMDTTQILTRIDAVKGQLKTTENFEMVQRFITSGECFY